MPGTAASCPMQPRQASKHAVFGHFAPAKIPAMMKAKPAFSKPECAFKSTLRSLV
jgi:hypothetical protein